MTVLEHFKVLCGIPHCSGNTEAMLAHLKRQAAAFGYEAYTDAAGNLLCAHPEAVLTLQAHYDMVCIGDAPELVLEETEGWLHARNSTLGADNGMGMAMMLSLMEEGAAVDCLFTSDEEIGLVGARALALPLKTPALLNLDSEAFGEITIGCAGGVDLNVMLPLRRSAAERYCYETTAEGYPGGHSGVDIDTPSKSWRRGCTVRRRSRWRSTAGSAATPFPNGLRRRSLSKRRSTTLRSGRWADVSAP